MFFSRAIAQSHIHLFRLGNLQVKGVGIAALLVHWNAIKVGVRRLMARTLNDDLRCLPNFLIFVTDVVFDLG